jgi:hypothetical protein
MGMEKADCIQNLFDVLDLGFRWIEVVGAIRARREKTAFAGNRSFIYSYQVRMNDTLLPAKVPFSCRKVGSGLYRGKQLEYPRLIHSIMRPHQERRRD